MNKERHFKLLDKPENEMKSDRQQLSRLQSWWENITYKWNLRPQVIRWWSPHDSSQIYEPMCGQCIFKDKREYGIFIISLSKDG